MNHHFINSILQWLLIAIVLTAIGALVLGVVADGGKGPTVIGLLIGGALIWAEHYTKKRTEKRDVLEMETSADKAEDGRMHCQRARKHRPRAIASNEKTIFPQP